MVDEYWSKLLTSMSTNETGAVNYESMVQLKGMWIYDFFILFSQFKTNIDKRLRKAKEKETQNKTKKDAKV